MALHLSSLSQMIHLMKSVGVLQSLALNGLVTVGIQRNYSL